MAMLKRRRWPVLLAALAGAALTARLGLWQLDRAAQKQALQARVEQRAALPPLPAAALAADAATAAQQFDRRIALRGRWLDERSVYLDNRQLNGRPGFILVTPLRLPGGDAVLVQRGWLPRDASDRTRLPPRRTSAGEVAIAGRIAPPPGRLFDFGGVDGGTIRQNLDLDGFGREIGVALRPLSLLQADDEADRGDGLLRQWPAAAVDAGKHQGYAFQWFALCALIVGLYVWFQLLAPLRRARAR